MVKPVIFEETGQEFSASERASGFENNEDIVTESVAISPAIPYRRSHPKVILTAEESPQAVSFGVSLDELRASIKILAPSASPFSLHQDAVVEKIQFRLRELGIRNLDGSEISLDGLCSIKFGSAISNLRSSLAPLGFEPGNHIDSKLIEYLLPRPTISNVEQGFLEINERNASEGQLKKVIVEVQKEINLLFKDARLLATGKWSGGLEARLLEIQEQNYFRPSGRIDAATLKLLRGQTHKELLACGAAVLIPSESVNRPALDFIRTIQALLNKYLKRELTLDGIFSEKTADVLETVQKALGVRERRIFSKESYDAIKSVLTIAANKKEFLKKIDQISLAQMLLKNLGDETKALSLSHKMNFISAAAKTPELVLLQSLEDLKIDIGSPASISSFQKKRGIIQDGKINQSTALNLYEVLSASWCKDRVRALGYTWRSNIEELNIVGLRGWSLETGQNNNEENEWNDTLAFIWKDKQARVHFREYIATTDPGTIDSTKRLSKGAGSSCASCLAQGQHKYVAGYFNGRFGAAIPINESPQSIREITRGREFLKNLKNCFKTYFLGSAPFAIHWMETYGDPDEVEEVGRFSLGSQVPRISKSVFKKEISPLFYADPDKVFLYTLIDMSLKGAD